MPIRVSETCQNISGHIKWPCMVIRRTCQFFATELATSLLGLLELQEDKPQADINQDNVSLAGCCKCSWSHSRYTRVRARRCCWAIIRGFHTIAGGTEQAVGTRLDAVFPILQRLVYAYFAAVEIGFYMLNVGHVSQI